MKILVVSHSCCTPINQQVYCELERQTGWNITIAVPANWRDEFGNILQATAWPGFNGRVVRIPVIGNGNIILHAYRVRWSRWLRDEDFALIYMNHEPYGLATAQVCWANQRANGVPFGFYSCQNIQKRYPPPFSGLERMVYRRSQFALPITTRVADVLRAKCFTGRIEVCALPFDPQRFRPYPAEEIPEALRPRGSGPWIGFVGRVVPEKGVLTLARALTLLADLRWRVALVGTGAAEGEFASILTAAGMDDRLTRTGYVSHTDTCRYLAGMDLLVLPSETQTNWKEQFGRVILEALACGVPVVGSNSGEIPYLVEQSGGGLVFSEREPQELAAAIRKMLVDRGRRENYARNGREWAVANASLSAIAGKMARVFTEAVNQSRRPIR